MSLSSKIFLSYSWKNNDTANLLDNDLLSVGISLTRDARDGEYRSSIKDFMKRVGDSDYVLVLMSDAFLKSEFCMYEVLELLNTHELEKRILPISIDDADVYSMEQRKLYYDYWDQKIQLAKEDLMKYESEDFQQQLKHCKNVRNNLPEFLSKVSDLIIDSYSKLRQSNYSRLFKVIGFDQNVILSECLAINHIEDTEDRELALEELLRKYPKSQQVLFQKAFYAFESMNYKSAEKYYKEVIEMNPDFTDAQYNLGLIYHKVEKLKNKDLAKRHYQNAIRIDQFYERAHYQLGYLLREEFKDYDLAKVAFKIAFRINPGNFSAMNNYAWIMQTIYLRNEIALYYYNIVVQKDPTNGYAWMNFGYMIALVHQNKILGATYYKKGLALNPELKDIIIEAALEM